MGLVLKIAAGIVLAVFVLAALVDTQVSVDDSTSSEISASIETPAFEAEPDDSLSSADWVWTADAEVECDDYVVCWQIDVTPPRDCPDQIYAELQIRDEADVVVDSTNASSLAPVTAGQTVRLTFDWFRDDDDTRKVQGYIASIECY